MKIGRINAGLSLGGMLLVVISCAFNGEGLKIGRIRAGLSLEGLLVVTCRRIDSGDIGEGMVVVW